MIGNAWTRTTPDEFTHNTGVRMSRGGASLQACVLVLLFAAACDGEYQRGWKREAERSRRFYVSGTPGECRTLTASSWGIRCVLCGEDHGSLVCPTLSPA